MRSLFSQQFQPIITGLTHALARQPSRFLVAFRRWGLDVESSRRLNPLAFPRANGNLCGACFRRKPFLTP